MNRWRNGTPRTILPVLDSDGYRIRSAGGDHQIHLAVGVFRNTKVVQLRAVPVQGLAIVDTTRVTFHPNTVPFKRI